MQKSMIKLLAIADIITLINAVLGFLAIIMLFSDQIRISFSLILLALLADGLDGIVARKTGKGKIGEYLEAMADMTSLGIAPALFVYVIYYDNVSWCIYYHSYLVVVLILFLLLNIIRLASFHIMKEKKYFIGLPASASTIFIITLAFLEIDWIYLIPVIMIISLIIVSNLRFLKPGFKINAVAAALIISTIILGKMYYNVAPILLLITLTIYVIAGPLYLRMKQIK